MCKVDAEPQACVLRRLARRRLSWRGVSVCSSSPWAAASRYLPLRIISVKLVLNSPQRMLSTLALDPGTRCTLSAIRQNHSWETTFLIQETCLSDERRVHVLRKKPNQVCRPVFPEAGKQFC